MSSKNKRGGKREGAGRKPASVPAFLKKFRATDEERREFMRRMYGDSRKDFVMVLNAIRKWQSWMEMPFKEEE